MNPPRVGLALMPEEGFRAAASPLFQEGLVDALEWAIDIPWSSGFVVPAWTEALLNLYSSCGRLYGHGVTFSALSARWEPRQEEWLGHLARELGRRRYTHVSEHFGFMSARGFRPGAPLPVPMTGGSVRVGREALGRLADVVGGPVGLENLAPVFGRRDADEQGQFIDALLAPTDGFLILDLHNVYCQAVCLGVSVRGLIERMPLDRVRELHVAGGSDWAAACAPGQGDPARHARWARPRRGLRPRPLRSRSLSEGRGGDASSGSSGRSPRRKMRRSFERTSRACGRR